MIIHIKTDSGPTTIASTGDEQTPEETLEAHGHDPAAVSYSVEKSAENRLSNLEAATGVGSKGPKQGIAHRIDDLEDRIADLEDAVY